MRLIVKVGTNVITRSDGLLHRPMIKNLVGQLSHLKKEGIEPILVSSGAVAAGRFRLGKTISKESSIGETQLLAAVGQVELMNIYSRLFLKSGYQCAQVLATKEDFRDRQHYLCMRECFSALLHDQIVPVVNENDVVAVSELMFTDNDELAGLLASMLNADALIILTSVDGLYDRPPEEKGAKMVSVVEADSPELKKYTSASGPRSSFGRGGMHTKCRVAEKLSHLGITTHVANGRKKGVILDLVRGERLGTTFVPRKKSSTIKKWLSQEEGREKGTIIINGCAVDLLRASDRARSLLPVGVTEVQGDFFKGDVVRIRGFEGDVVGYGLAQYGSDVARENIGKRNKKPVVHYDYLYLNPGIS